jgi:hypothetical protein
MGSTRYNIDEKVN